MSSTLQVTIEVVNAIELSPRSDGKPPTPFITVHWNKANQISTPTAQTPNYPVWHYKIKLGPLSGIFTAVDISCWDRIAEHEDDVCLGTARLSLTEFTSSGTYPVKLRLGPCSDTLFAPRSRPPSGAAELIVYLTPTPSPSLANPSKPLPVRPTPTPSPPTSTHIAVLTPSLSALRSRTPDFLQPATPLPPPAGGLPLGPSRNRVKRASYTTDDVIDIQRLQRRIHDADRQGVAELTPLQSPSPKKPLPAPPSLRRAATKPMALNHLPRSGSDGTLSIETNNKPLQSSTQTNGDNSPAVSTQLPANENASQSGGKVRSASAPKLHMLHSLKKMRTQFKLTEAIVGIKPARKLSQSTANASSPPPPPAGMSRHSIGPNRSLDDTELFMLLKKARENHHVISLPSLLRVRRYREAFRAYLSHEFSAENLDCYMAIERLKNMTLINNGDSAASANSTASAANDDGAGDPRVVAMVTSIYREFIVAGSPHEVNIPANIRNSVSAAIAGPPERITKNTLNDVQQHLLGIMSTDAYRRFTLTDTFRRLVSDKAGGPSQNASSVRIPSQTVASNALRPPAVAVDTLAGTKSEPLSMPLREMLAVARETGEKTDPPNPTRRNGSPPPSRTAPNRPPMAPIPKSTPSLPFLNRTRSPLKTPRGQT